MKETIMTQFLEKSMSYLQSAEVFTKKELPLFIEETLNFNLYYSSMWIILFLIIIIICSVFMFCIHKVENTFSRTDKEAFTVMVIVAYFTCVLFIGMDAKTIIKIKVAPRLFLIEKVRSLTR